MREIKFRAWYINNNCWVQNPMALFFVNYYHNGGIPIFMFDVKGMYDLYRQGFRLQQFTGLHDNKGKEIYEGDIVKFRSHPDKTKIAEVKFSERVASFDLYWFDNDIEFDRKYPSIKSFNHINTIEVIGNIYENKELLDAKQT